MFDLPFGKARAHPTQKDDYIKRITGLPKDSRIVFDHGFVLSSKQDTHRGSDASPIGIFPIPQKGQDVCLLKNNQSLWQSILIRDGNAIKFNSVTEGYINNNAAKIYKVQQSYYFVEGDNSVLSADSRNWGLLPHSNLIGQAVLKRWPWPPKFLH